jgi:hypothetical protein
MLKDLAELLKSLPGAAKAVAHLIAETGNAGAALLSIGTAKAKQVAQAVSDETAARSKLSAALTKAAEKYIAANAQALGKRALDHGIRRIMEQQANREAVTTQALENLLLDPPKQPPGDTPSDDWLNLFGSYAERASSETMRQHWAQILNGEIRKPGSFSMVTLQIASVLDKRLATIIQTVCSWIVDGDYVPTIGKLNEGEIYGDLLTLDGIGFLRVGAASKFYTSGPQGHLALPLGSKTLWGRGPPDKRFAIRAAFLTLAGRELLSIISYQQNPELEELLTKELQSQGATNIQALSQTPGTS